MKPNNLLNAQFGLKQSAIIMAAIGLVVFVVIEIVQSQKEAAQIYNSEIIVKKEMPTAEECVRWAFLEAETKYYSFEPVHTNITFAPKEVTYGGKYDADRERENEQTFGSAYDGSDSFTRTETNWVCELTITHSKPKPASKITRIFRTIHDVDGNGRGEGAEPDPKDWEQLLKLDELDPKYSSYEIIKTDYYKVARVVGGNLMKPVNTERGIGYVWDTENYDKFSTKNLWVFYAEVGSLTKK